MAKGINPEAIGDAIARELTIYSEQVNDRVNACGEEAAAELVSITKATAPKKTGSFRKHIAYKEVAETHGLRTYVWHVKAPDYRITHLLVHGHAKQNGGRIPGSSFLQDALDKVLPDYEAKIKEAVRGD